eukprot:CAMPEP_0196578992 /NCGR_PEP_ID=MMETSP1081-20130531/15530_1 /TAXON_ID=36882 /ORGANISM="Pyramimonas amylifera, Strain CCMP720" /LENGTH=110 /DNA_ID=CAMNT_0041898413 /DNA_START=168 /DNA_END=497 /DNA_ORIENTATION=-
MPLYDLLLIIKPIVTRPQVADILKRAGSQVIANGGVVTDFASYGTRPLAYDFKKAGERFDEGSIVQVSFMIGPKVLSDLEHELRVDDRVMRWMFWKKPKAPSLKKLKKDW